MKTFLIAEVDATELTLRIAEAACDIKRPPHRDAATALAQLRARDPITTASFERIAYVVTEYITECIGKGRRPS
ncbi:hypothetical protein [Methylobacterium sp. J-092]|uniref:hypothetical protein n=1 Tax=Methylobacterium sp. J-092 TaxID=2836667 RepID=UPI001FBA02ED|nr:hypothetical protein [Methylobacterium sp. J-092]MCJ2009763.1 hypothetical protein [Methylobacterium sp. J-092]